MFSSPSGFYAGRGGCWLNVSMHEDGFGVSVFSVCREILTLHRRNHLWLQRESPTRFRIVRQAASGELDLSPIFLFDFWITGKPQVFT